MQVVVAGASGALGRCVARALAARGHAVRAVGRSAERTRRALGDVAPEARVFTWNDRGAACRDADAILSCVGATTRPVLRGWRPYTSVDVRANTELIEAARTAGAPRFVYVSVHHDDAMRGLGYVRAHERVVDALHRSGLDAYVLRPTGFFSAFDAMLDMARSGAIPEIGGGTARTNPIADADLADLCVEALEGRGPRERSAGGPEILTRRDIADLAFRAVGAAPRHRKVPAGVLRAIATVMRPLHPRLSQLVSFITAISERDLVAEPAGTQRLEHYLRDRARA